MALKKLWMCKLQKYFEFQSKFIVYFFLEFMGPGYPGAGTPKRFLGEWVVLGPPQKKEVKRGIG